MTSILFKEGRVQQHQFTLLTLVVGVSMTPLMPIPNTRLTSPSKCTKKQTITSAYYTAIILQAQALLAQLRIPILFGTQVHPLVLLHFVLISLTTYLWMASPSKILLEPIQCWGLELSCGNYRPQRDIQFTSLQLLTTCLIVTYVYLAPNPTSCWMGRRQNHCSQGRHASTRQPCHGHSNQHCLEPSGGFKSTTYA